MSSKTRCDKVFSPRSICTDRKTILLAVCTLNGIWIYVGGNVTNTNGCSAYLMIYGCSMKEINFKDSIVAQILHWVASCFTSHQMTKIQQSPMKMLMNKWVIGW
jgi:hypothetical protein